MGQATHSPEAAWDAICRSQAVIEFDPSGIVLWANDRFLATMGYALAEIQGQHHRIFCEPGHGDTPPPGPAPLVEDRALVDHLVQRITPHNAVFAADRLEDRIVAGQGAGMAFGRLLAKVTASDL